MGTLIYFYNKMGIGSNRKAVMGWRIGRAKLRFATTFLGNREMFNC